MAVSKDDILEAISNMTVVEIVDLIEAMEEKFGVTAAAPVAAAAAPAAAAAAAEEQTEFNVVMTKQSWRNQSCPWTDWSGLERS